MQAASTMDSARAVLPMEGLAPITVISQGWNPSVIRSSCLNPLVMPESWPLRSIRPLRSSEKETSTWAEVSIVGVSLSWVAIPASRLASREAMGTDGSPDSRARASAAWRMVRRVNASFTPST
ncbi:MAG: hypothetical protein JW395_3783 [Nitrospira sp.]|nr:hypothetical protein [Nitrospira sp.]